MTKVSIKNSNKIKDFYNEKINNAKYFFEKIDPRIDTHYKSCISGSKTIMNFKFN